MIIQLKLSFNFQLAFTIYIFFSLLIISGCIKSKSVLDDYFLLPNIIVHYSFFGNPNLILSY